MSSGMLTGTPYSNSAKSSAKSNDSVSSDTSMNVAETTEFVGTATPESEGLRGSASHSGVSPSTSHPEKENPGAAFAESESVARPYDAPAWDHVTTPISALDSSTSTVTPKTNCAATTADAARTPLILKPPSPSRHRCPHRVLCPTPQDLGRPCTFDGPLQDTSRDRPCRLHQCQDRRNRSPIHPSAR